MEGSLRKNQRNIKLTDKKTVTVPLASGEMQENITVTTNTSTRTSKEQIINQAFKFHSQGNILEAAKYYQLFINQGFNDPIVFSNYGTILKDLGKSQEAEIFTRKAIELKPDYANAHFNLGNILKNLGKLQKAVMSTRKAIELKPDYANAYLNLGTLLGELGQLQEAEIAYRKVIELKPNFAQAYCNLGGILNDLGKLEEAELSVRKAIELEPDFAMAHYKLGNILKECGDLEQAGNSLKKAIKLEFGFVQAHDALAVIQDKLGHRKESEDSSKKILYLKSHNASNFNSKKSTQKNLYMQPSPIEHEIFYRPGMGTENVGSFLRSMVTMLRPKRILEIGAGYTTPFLLEGIINNHRIFDDGNLNESYFKKYTYDPKLIVIDNTSQGDLKKVDGMNEIMESEYTDFVEGNFEGKAERLYKMYGYFDFVWLDCGGQNEYTNFFKEYWPYCSNYIFFHFTYQNGIPNSKHKVIQDNLRENSFMFDIVEPHKKRQGSITMVRKEKFKNKI